MNDVYVVTRNSVARTKGFKGAGHSTLGVYSDFERAVSIIRKDQSYYTSYGFEITEDTTKNDRISSEVSPLTRWIMSSTMAYKKPITDDIKADESDERNLRWITWNVKRYELDTYPFERMRTPRVKEVEPNDEGSD